MPSAAVVRSKEPDADTPQETGGTVVGEVRGLSQRVEQPSGDPEQVWSFRVEQHDEAGNRLRPTPVELRGERFRGVIADGDWVRINGRWKSGTLIADTVANVTTGGELVARNWSTARLVAVGVIGVAVVVILALLGVAVRGFIATRNEVQRGIDEVQREGEEFDQQFDEIRRQVEEGIEP